MLSSISYPAHPRSRGEHTLDGEWIPRRRGSSPLARGTQSSQLWFMLPRRLIPARAGNTCLPFPIRRYPAAHPRSRGEHSMMFRCSLAGNGSSPLARGTLFADVHKVIAARLIPARAGNTIGFSLSHGVTSAHPRSRGEHTKSPSTTSYRRGSSPLARGTRLYSGFHRLARRLIPAHAGNTVKRDATIDLSTAHPRSRGEHPNVCQVPKSELGSSPLARGTRL